MPDFFQESKMKKEFLLILAVIATFGGAQLSAEPTKQKYTCPMHPEVVMDAPGKCPKCGMTLVPVKREKKRPTANVQPASAVDELRRGERPRSNEEKKAAAH